MPSPTICTITGNVKNLLGTGVQNCTIYVSVITPFIHPTGGSLISGELESVVTNSSGDFSIAVVETTTPGIKVRFVFDYYDGVSNRRQKTYAVVVPDQANAVLTDLIVADTNPVTTNTFPAASVTVSTISGLSADNAQDAFAEHQTDIDTINTALTNKQSTTLSSAHILVGSASNLATDVAVSGDVTINNAGVVAIGATKVTNAMLAGSIAASKLVGSDIATVGTITSGTWNGTTLDIAHGGTNSAATLNNNRVMKSSGGAIVEATAITASRALVSDVNGIPVHATTTSTEIGFVNGVTSAIQTQFTGKVDKSTLTTKGDTYVATAASTVVRQAIGADNTVLTADSTQTNGLKWAALSSIGGLQPAKNFLINGAFDWWQRGTSITGIANGSSTYGPDRWYAKNSLGTNGVIRLDQTTGVTNGSKYGCSIKISTAPTVAQTNGCELYQTIENLHTYELYSQNASFSVLVKALGNVNQVGVQFFYKTTEAKVDTAIGAEQTFTVTTGAFATCSISGQALGTTLTVNGVIGVRIRITTVSTGNTYDLNNGFICEQAIVNLGSAPATFQRAGRTPQNELAMAQRFTYSPIFTAATGSNIPISMGAAISTTAALCVFSMMTPLRVNAASVTISAAADFSYRKNDGTAVAASAISLNRAGTNYQELSVTVASGLVAGDAGTFETGSSSATMYFDAEI